MSELKSPPARHAATDGLAALVRSAGEFLGPIAGVLVQRLAGEAASMSALREAVALHIDDRNARERFRQHTLHLIAGSLPAATPKAGAAAVLPARGRFPEELVQQLAEELLPSLGAEASRVVREQAARSASRVQLFLRLSKLVDEPQRRQLETRALHDHRVRLG